MRLSRLHSAHVLAVLISFFCFVLVLAKPASAHAQGATISGNLLGATTNASIDAYNVNTGSIYSAQVGGGKYTITGLPAGTYRVSVEYLPAYTVTPSSITVVAKANSNNPNNNFTFKPSNNYIVSGTVFMPGPTCPGASNSTNVTVNMFGPNYSAYSTSAYVYGTGAQLSGRYSFFGLPPGQYTVFINQTADYTGSGQINTTAILSTEYDQNFSISPRSFNVCGYVTGAVTSGPVYLFTSAGYLQQTNVTYAPLQPYGTFVFQHVPPNVYGVFMVNPTDGSYTYSPAWPQFQYAWVGGGDVGNIYFSATQNVSDVTGNFVGLPANQLQSVNLYQWLGTKWSAQPIATTSTMNSIPFVFHNIHPGNYYVLPSAPNNPYGTITPLLLGGFPVYAGGQTVNAGTFTYTVNKSASYAGIAYLTNANATWLNVPTVTLTVYGQYPGDTNTIFLSNLNDYSTRIPLRFGATTHPGAYTWRLTGLGNLRVNYSSGSFNLAPNGFYSFPDLKFTLPPGGNAYFNQNNCGSAVCSGDPGGGTALKAGGVLQKLSASSIGKHAGVASPGNRINPAPGSAAVACTAPITDTPEIAASAAATVSAGGSGSSAGSGTTTTTCGSTVDITNVPTIDFNGGFGPPDPNNPGHNLPDSTLPAKNTTVTFSGVLYAAVDGDYQFQTTTNGPVKFSIEGQTIIDNWIDSQQTQTAAISLTGGQQYTYTMSYAYDDVSSAAVNLSWQQPNDTAMNTIDQSFFASAPSLVPLQDLTLQQAGQVVDNYTTGDPVAQQVAIAAGYTVARVEGCAYPSPLPGTVSLDVYYNGSDYFTTTTDQTQPTPDSANYTLVGTAGYIFPTPLTDGSTIPLQTWNGNNDNYAAASQAGLNAAQQAGYVFLQTEGYVLPATSCQSN